MRDAHGKWTAPAESVIKWSRRPAVQYFTAHRAHLPVRHSSGSVRQCRLSLNFATPFLVPRPPFIIQRPPSSVRRPHSTAHIHRHYPTSPSTIHRPPCSVLCPLASSSDHCPPTTATNTPFTIHYLLFTAYRPSVHNPPLTVTIHCLLYIILHPSLIIPVL